MDTLSPPTLQWRKNEQKQGREFTDGQVFLIAVPVKNNTTGAEYWDIDKVQMDCDGEEAHMNYYGGDSFGSWIWDDVEYYIEILE